MNQAITFCAVFRNEAQRVRYVLDLAKSFFPEMVIAVQESEDGTEKIVGEYTKNILHHPSQSPEESRDAVMERVKTPWAFWLDADEFPSFELIAFLLIFNPEQWINDGFKFPRINYVNGFHIEANSEEDSQFRLVRSDVRWKPQEQGSRIHIYPLVKDTIKLDYPIYHHRSFEKIDRQTERWNELEPKTQAACNAYRERVKEELTKR